MAAWQYKLSLIPSSWVISKGWKVDDLYSEEGYDTIGAWKENQPNRELANIIDKYYSRGESWSEEDFTYWGTTKETDVHLWNENSSISELAIRIDLSRPFGDEVTKVLELAKEAACYIFVPEQKLIIPAERSKLEKSIKNSNAAQFVTNPDEWFKRVAKTKT